MLFTVFLLNCSWKLELWCTHELMGNFLCPKMSSPSPDNEKLLKEDSINLSLHYGDIVLK